MKRRRINLFSLTLKKFDFVSATKKIQLSMIGFLVVLLLLLGISAIANNYLDQELEAISRSERPLQQYFQNNSNFDKQIKYFIYKYRLLQEYLKLDANAYTYHQTLQNHILSVSPNALLNSFQIDNAGQIQFNVSFPSYDDSQTFLNALETPEFIEPFEYLKLSSFDLSSDDSDNFQLSIEGKFLKK